MNKYKYMNRTEEEIEEHKRIFENARLKAKFKVVMFCPIDIVSGPSAPKKVATSSRALNIIRSVSMDV